MSAYNPSPTRPLIRAEYPFGLGFSVDSLARALISLADAAYVSLPALRIDRAQSLDSGRILVYEYATRADGNMPGKYVGRVYVPREYFANASTRGATNANANANAPTKGATNADENARTNPATNAPAIEPTNQSARQADAICQNGLTSAQFLARLLDYVPSAYVRTHRAELESFFTNGCTVSETVEYLRAWLSAPRITPQGWEGVHPYTRERAEALAPGDSPQSYAQGLERLMRDVLGDEWYPGD